MDRALYIAMSGAKQNTLGQAAHANNLANASTTGFRSDYTQSRAMGVFGEHFPTRAYAMTERPASDFTQGPLVETGRAQDVSIEGPGWFAVVGPDGNEAYTRAGDLSVDPNGRLITGTGLQLLGDGGPVVLPEYEKIEISRAGIVTVQPAGEVPAAVAEPVQLKLVNPDMQLLEKGEDGLFRFRDPAVTQAPADPNITLVNGFIEGSNVNAVTELTSLISLNRQYEMQVKLMKSADENSAATTQILSNQ
ncbi:flagellar biosynthesis protein FlgF [Thalassolituus oleivorans]|jgi:flagellar basal-body rod protein FlgF|uniref:flagellar basal body rod protein FlgF n=1 Tax=Thalassolituus oleivorans TaxID=187493 RepID=UPI000949499A|nr:flagellar basal body rod protein FlgF [Thalassolituus oleivorans]APR66420.1 flagellar biosynthesis protein FlgF [Thalassolituus oleivorans]